MILIYLSPVSWESMAQRPHFFTKFCLDSQIFDKVYWVNSIPSRFPKKSDFRTKIIGIEPKSISTPENMEVINPGFFVPIEPIPRLFHIINYFQIKKLLAYIERILIENRKVILVMGKPSQLGVTLLEKFSFYRTIIDVMDDFPYFFEDKARSAMSFMMMHIISKVDIVWFSSHALADKYNHLCNKYEIVLNACSDSFLSTLQEVNASNFKKDNEIIYGYIGSINDWFDWDFILKLSKSQRDSLIKLVGPCYTQRPNLPDNVHIYPAIEHKYIPKLLREFNYGLIPFKLNELTASVDPVKYYEYCAAELPVISTEFGEMKHRIAEGYACTLEQHLLGKKAKIDKCTVWEDCFQRVIDIS